MMAGLLIGMPARARQRSGPTLTKAEGARESGQSPAHDQHLLTGRAHAFEADEKASDEESFFSARVRSC